MKAAFLYHFAQLVTWPARPATGARTPRKPIVIAIVGPDPFGDRIETTIGAEDVRGRPIRIVRAPNAAALGLRPDILFLGAARAEEAGEALASVRGAPVLTVASCAGFAERGGMIGFRLTPEGRVVFDINLRAVERAGLKMSSQLLKIARIVETDR